MNRREFLGAAGAACFARLGRGAAGAKRPPNIVFILADDLGYKDVGFMGSRYYQTPNIDRLAGQGMVFTNCYASPTCAPSRARLISGQYETRHHIYAVDAFDRTEPEFQKLATPSSETVLPRSYITMAETLKRAGYVSASIGKWHLGFKDGTDPTGQGFDENIAGTELGSVSSYFAPYSPKAHPEGLPGLEKDPPGTYVTDRLTQEAEKFIEANRNRPFFLYLPHFTPHAPLNPKPELLAKYKGRPGSDGQDNPWYAAMIDPLDESVARVLKKLDDLRLADNTVVILTSDNGPRIKPRKNDPWPHISAVPPFRGEKGMIYEGGIRVPMLVRWPGVKKAGRRCDVPVGLLDFHPTLMQIAGLAPQKGQVLDGESLVPLLRSSGGLKRQAIYWHLPVYTGKTPHQNLWQAPCSAIRKGGWKLIRYYEDGYIELYNLVKDPGERTNLASRNPDKARDLAADLAEWLKQTHAVIPAAKRGK